MNPSLRTRLLSTLLVIGALITGFAAGLPAGEPEAMQQAAAVSAIHDSAYPAPQVDPSAPAQEPAPTF